MPGVNINGSATCAIDSRYMERTNIAAARRLLAAALIAGLTAAGACAQKQRGDIFIMPQAGINVSRLSGYDVLTGATENAPAMESSGKAGLTAGLEAEYMAARNVGVRLGLLYSEQGDRVKNIPGMDVKTRLRYLCIPLTAHYYITDWLGVHAGVQYSRLTDDNCTAGDDIGVPPALYSDDDWGIPIGASVEYSNVVLNLSYVVGLTKTCSALGDTQNRSLQLTLGYRIRL